VAVGIKARPGASQTSLDGLYSRKYFTSDESRTTSLTACSMETVPTGHMSKSYLLACETVDRLTRKDENP